MVLTIQNMGMLLEMLLEDTEEMVGSFFAKGKHCSSGDLKEKVTIYRRSPSGHCLDEWAKDSDCPLLHRIPKQVSHAVAV